MQAVHDCLTGLIVGLAILTSISSAAENEAPANALTQFGDIQGSLRRAKDEGNWQRFLQHSEQLRTFVHGSPSAELEVARGQLNLHLNSDAEASISRALSMGVTHPILASPLFQPVTNALSTLRMENEESVRGATIAMTIGDTALLPEDIDYDLARGRFYVTSVLRGEVVRLDKRGQSTTFARSPDHWPMVALKIDSQRRRLWATEVAFDGFTTVPKQDWGRSAVLEYSLDRGTLLRRIEGPPHSNLGDLILVANGDAIVSDGDGGGIYRVIGSRLHRLDHGEFVSPQTPALCPDDPTLFIPDYVRGLAAMNLVTGKVRWLATRNKFALDETDGLYCEGRTLVAVQNGMTHPRVVAYQLKGGGIIKMDIIERSPEGDFTHGVLVHGQFYFLAATGWRNLNEQGQLRVGSSQDHAVVMRRRVTSDASTPSKLAHHL